MPANATAIILTSKDSSIFGVLAKNDQKYKPITALATKKAASQIRRCQKRFNVTGLILPPTCYVNLVIIMTIKLSFYK